MVENCTIRFAFRANLSMMAIHRRCAGDLLGQIAECCQSQLATTSQVGRRDMRTRLKGFFQGTVHYLILRKKLMRYRMFGEKINGIWDI